MIKVETKLADKEIKRMQKRAQKVKSLKPAHKNISVLLDRWVLNNFKTEGGNVGGWQPFAEYCVGGKRSKYRKIKTCGRGRIVGKGKSRRLDTSAKLLQDTGRLRGSFFPPFYTSTTVGIGSELPYSEPHEKGEGSLPKRRMLPEDKDVRKQVIRLYKHFIDEAMK